MSGGSWQAKLHPRCFRRRTARALPQILPPECATPAVVPCASLISRIKDDYSTALEVGQGGGARRREDWWLDNWRIQRGSRPRGRSGGVLTGRCVRRLCYRRTNRVQAYDPRADSWVPATPLSAPGSAAMGRGIVLLAGNTAGLPGQSGARSFRGIAIPVPFRRGARLFLALRCFQWNRSSHSWSSDGSAPALTRCPFSAFGRPVRTELRAPYTEPLAPYSSRPASDHPASPTVSPP